MASPTVQKVSADETNGFLSQSIAGQPDLLFAWLSPYAAAEQRSSTRPHLPPTSPLLRAKHALKRTFTPSKQMNKQQERGKPAICKSAPARQTRCPDGGCVSRGGSRAVASGAALLALGLQSAPSPSSCERLEGPCRPVQDFCLKYRCCVIVSRLN